MLVAGCRGPDTAPAPAASPAPEAPASTRSGPLPFALVEQALRQREGPAGADREAMVAAYRRASEELAVRRALLPQTPEALEAALSALGSERDGLRGQATAELYLQQRRLLDLNVSDAQARAWYAAHPALFHRPGQRVAWHIFRRHADPGRPQDTLALVAGLRARIVAGASFADVAREHSHSETRILGGRLGLVSPGRLPKALERVLFALGENELSAPLATRQGVFLFRATQIVPERRLSFDDMRLSVLRELREQRRRDVLAEAVRGQALPAGARVLDGPSLRRTMALGEDEPVLELGGLRLTVKQLRETYLARRRGTPPPLEPERDFERFYGGLADAQRLYLKANAEGFVTQNEANLRLLEARLAADRLLAAAVEQRMWQRLDADSGLLERFYGDNGYLYQTPLRLRLRTLSADVGAQPGLRLARLEAAREELVAGRSNLESVAAELGGRVVGPQWVADRELAGFEAKVRYYLLDMNGPGYTVAFQLNRQLLLIQVVAREEPRLRPLAEVRADARRDCFERSQQELYRGVVADVLRSESFQFDEAAVRRRLAMAAGVP